MEPIGTKQPSADPQTGVKTRSKGKELVSPPKPKTNKRKKIGITSESEAENEFEATESASKKAKMNEMEQSLMAMAESDNPSPKDLMKAMLAIHGINNEKFNRLEASHKQIDENTRQIKKVNVKVTEVEAKHDALADKVALLEQIKLETQMSITGFSSVPDAVALKRSLRAIFNINQNSILHISSFTIKKLAGGTMIVTNVHLANSFDKSHIMSIKKEKGVLKAYELLALLKDDQGAQNIIYIGHKLTSTNLKIRQALKKLKEENKIVEKRFWNNRFQIKAQLSQGQWKDVLTLSALNNLHHHE